MFAPTAGNHVVAVNAVTGVEIWRFAPEGEGRPAYRGLIYWPGDGKGSERVLFCAGKYLYALDPKTGRPVANFGKGGKTELPGEADGDFGAATACPAIFQHIIIVPGFQKDVCGFDVVTGELLWTFHTVPHAGEFGYDTWDHTEGYAANDWSGMALDEVRGIAYIITGGAKPISSGWGISDRICSRTASSRWMPAQGNGSGISRKCGTTSGTRTSLRRRISRASSTKENA
jgi:quinoprotein glucose dehydrogenase